MSALNPLKEMVAQGLQPKGRIVWLGLGFMPPKFNAIEIDQDKLPTDSDCSAVAGLDVNILFHGFQTKYGTLKRLCEALYQARPARLQNYDLDYRKYACLKLGNNNAN